MDNGYIVSGMLFGDEGKGSVTDFLASIYDTKYNVRYNGGSQAAHTVKNGNHSHKFSQLGSSLMNMGTTTFLSSNTIVNPFSLIREASIYGEETKSSSKRILEKVFIDKEAKIVTPYHSLITRINELSRKELQGSTGSGVSEVKRIHDLLGIDITIEDILKMDNEVISKFHELHDYTSLLLEIKNPLIDIEKYNKYLDGDELDKLTNEKNRDYMINCYKNLIDSDLLNIDTFNNFYKGGNLVFEGSQGVMIDKDYGIKPNVTGCDTTNKFAYTLSNEIGINPISVGCVSVYNSRHGAGLLTTNDPYLDSIIYDENQVPSYYQGIPRYGWLDLVILRYTLSINKVDKLFLTMIDRYSNIDKIKICNAYKYLGTIDDEFINTFDFYTYNGEIIITNIKNSDNLKKYLSYVEPIYEEIDGYNFDLKDIKSINDLPDNLFKYIEYIEKNASTSINYLSYGPDRKNKVVYKK